MKTFLAILGGVWLIGRISRCSPHHPVHAVSAILSVQGSVGAQPNPENGTSDETAQIQGSLVLGEGGGE